jgi:CheY-like chemotaxis protein
MDLVLLDIEMPGLDGIEMLKRLKAGSRCGSIPVIVISGVEEIASVVKCIELGAEDYLSKPFNPVILRDSSKSPNSTGWKRSRRSAMRSWQPPGC